MSTTQMILAGALIVIDLLVCMTIGIKTRGKAKNAEDYFIGGKRTGTFLLFLTAWASFSGAGNFIGQAEGEHWRESALTGFGLAKLMGGIIMGYILAPYLADLNICPCLILCPAISLAGTTISAGWAAWRL